MGEGLIECDGMWVMWWNVVNAHLAGYASRVPAGARDTSRNMGWSRRSLCEMLRSSAGHSSYIDQCVSNSKVKIAPPLKLQRHAVKIQNEGLRHGLHLMGSCRGTRHFTQHGLEQTLIL